MHKRTKRTFITKTFIKGLTVVVPVFVALYVLLLVFTKAEQVVKQLITAVIPPDYYITGLGVALFALAIFAVGLLMYPWITKKISKPLDSFSRRIPLFGLVYSPIKDLMNLLGDDVGTSLGDPVMVELDHSQTKMVGFLTRSNAEGLPEGFIPPNHVVVFVPWSSQIGGFCFVVPKERIRPLDITAEEAIRWSFTAGLSGPENHGPK
ncbi:MAG: DUF502 domain-containing protein [Deltaproteobacteria bacterium]|nr:DUF502 domain-containing protein [Deltaproteobacteria bacterium]